LYYNHMSITEPPAAQRGKFGVWTFREKGAQSTR
jgi:hypothetical protein